MATKRKSIIEEALLEAKSLEDALKANTKEMLATHMKQEIENIVETSLKTKDVNDGGSDVKTEMPVTEQAEEELAVLTGDDSEEEVEDIDLDVDIDAEEDESELDLDLDLDDLEDEEGLELDIAELPIDIEIGGEEELDLTNSPDDEVLKVFKAMSDDDEVEVIKDEDGIHLTDNETGAEYYIKESEQLDEDGLCEGCGGDHVDEDDELVYEIELDEDDTYGQGSHEYRRHNVGGVEKRAGEGPEGHYKDYMKEDDKYGQGSHEYRRHNVGGVEKRAGEGPEGHYKDYMDEHDDWGSDKDEYKRRSSGGVKHRAGDVGGGKYGKGGHYKDYELDEEADWGSNKDEYKRRSSGGVKHRAGDVGGGKYGKGGHYKDYELDEDKIQRHQSNGYQRKSGAKVGSDQATPYGGTSESKRSRRPISNKRKEARNVSKVSDSKIMKEYKELKSKNEQYKGALKVFKDKLNEVALFNTNLAYVNRLFTEHTTSKKEKMEILKRFDGAEDVKNSKIIYKVIKEELDKKTPLTESVEKRVTKIVKSSKSDLNESTAYVDPQITAIKDLMKRIS